MILQGLREQLLDISTARQQGNYDIRGSFPFLPEPFDTFKHSLLNVAIYHQDLQAVKMITQINEACLPSKEKQERGLKFKRAQAGSYGHFRCHKLSSVPYKTLPTWGLFFGYIPLSLHHTLRVLFSLFQTEVEFDTLKKKYR